MRTLIGVLSLLLALVSPAAAAEVRLSVAPVLTDAARDLISAYEQQAEGVRVLPNVAASGSLAKQIVQGAPADIFISAHPQWMEFLVEKQRIPADGVRILARNALVFVGRKGLAVTSLADLDQLGRIAIGSPKSVSAGLYAEQALRAAGLYEPLQGKLIMAKDVRQALVYADRGETDGAFVFRTDARLAREAVVLLEVPAALHDEVRYPMGMTATGAEKPEAVAFFAFLQSPAATRILQKHGFIVK